LPLLDLSFLTAEPLIAGDRFDVARRQEVVDQGGRVTIVEETFRAQLGAVYPTGPNDLVRDPDRGYATKTITVVTKFPLRMTATGYQPDQVVWPCGSSDRYVVSRISDFSRYGTGFVEATCSAIDAQQSPV
jgi:hypothetical protein